MDATEVTIALASIVVFGVGAQWLARRTGLPSIVLLLLAGIFAGPVTGLVDPEELFGEALDPLVGFAVGLLLFHAGLTLRYSELPRGLNVVNRLVSLGALVTMTVGAVAAYLIFDMSVSVAVMLGVVLIVSGPTAVGPIIRSSRPMQPTGEILEWEGGILDPVGAALGTAVLTVIVTEGSPVVGTIGILAATAAVGVGIGLACAALYVLAWRNHAIPDDLQVPVAFMFAVVAFASANLILSEAGLFASITLGLALTNQPFASVLRIRRFESSIGTLVVAGLFIVLAATIDLEDMRAVIPESALLLVVLVLVARPLAAFVSTLGSTLRRHDRLFVASVAPRGIVAASTVSFYAINLENEGFATDDMVPVTFAVIIGAGIVYGFGSPLMARLLGVMRAEPRGVAIFGTHTVIAPVADHLVAAGVPVLVIDRGASPDDIKPTSGYEVFTGAVVSDELLGAFRRQDVGTALVAAGDLALDVVATKRCVRELGRSKTFFLPMEAESDSGIESRWRSRTPDRFVAFGPDVTVMAVRDLLGDDGELGWCDAGADGVGLPDDAIPLFIVTAEQRCLVASLESLAATSGAAEGRGRARVLFVRPADGHRAR